MKNFISNFLIIKDSFFESCLFCAPIIAPCCTVVSGEVLIANLVMSPSPPIETQFSSSYIFTIPSDLSNRKVPLFAVRSSPKAFDKSSTAGRIIPRELLLLVALVFAVSGLLKSNNVVVPSTVCFPPIDTCAFANIANETSRVVYIIFYSHSFLYDFWVREFLISFFLIFNVFFKIHDQSFIFNHKSHASFFWKKSSIIFFNGNETHYFFPFFNTWF